MTEKGSTFNDSVHGSITLPPLCVRILDTVEFQRLRNVKQLGLAYLVYPGASHNRFEHSLGVCHLAGRMVDQLNYNHGDSEKLISVEEKLCVQIAGLCHDLGHGPFSHAWEGFLEEKADSEAKKQAKDHETSTSTPDKWKHEKCSVKMFQHMIDSNELIPEFEKFSLRTAEIVFIKELIAAKPVIKKDRPYLYEIISNSLNGVDVDKWDYFLRDSKYLNLAQSFDHNRLLTTCRVMEVEGEHNESGKMHIAFREKDVPNVWDMFQVRAQLHSKAYQHPVVKILEQMWTDALIAAEEEGYTISNAKGVSVLLSNAQYNLDVWKYVTDHIFYNILNNRECRKAREILERILNRDIYNEIIRYKVKDPSSKEKAKEKSKEIETFLETIRGKFPPGFDYCLRHLSFNMGAMKKDDEPFDNFFFYAKDATRARSINISTGAVFAVDAQKLERHEIMVVSTGRKCNRPGEDPIRTEIKEFIRNL